MSDIALQQQCFERFDPWFADDGCPLDRFKEIFEDAEEITEEMFLDACGELSGHEETFPLRTTGWTEETFPLRSTGWTQVGIGSYQKVWEGVFGHETVSISYYDGGAEHRVWGFGISFGDPKKEVFCNASFNEKKVMISGRRTETETSYHFNKCYRHGEPSHGFLFNKSKLENHIAIAGLSPSNVRFNTFGELVPVSNMKPARNRA